MAAARFLVLIAYDVADDRDRRRLAELLEGQLVRVQESLFEGWMTEVAARRLAEAAAAHVDQGDSLRLYLVPPRDVGRARAWGFPPAPEAGGLLIL